MVYHSHSQTHTHAVLPIRAVSHCVRRLHGDLIMIIPSVVRQRRTARIREEDSNIITLKPMLQRRTGSRCISRPCNLSLRSVATRGSFLFMIVPSVVRQRRTARICEEDSNIITLKPTLTFYFQAVQYAWSHYTGGDSNLITLSHSISNSLCFFMLQRRTGSLCNLVQLCTK